MITKPDLSLIDFDTFTDAQESEYFRLYDMLWGVAEDNRRIHGVTIHDNGFEAIIYAGVWQSTYYFETVFEKEETFKLLLDAIECAVQSGTRDLDVQKAARTAAVNARNNEIIAQEIATDLDNAVRRSQSDWEKIQEAFGRSI